MQHFDDGRRPAPRSPRLAVAIGCAAAVSLAALSAAACNKAAGPADAGGAGRAVAAATRGRVSACALIPKEEFNAITGASYTATEANDDGHSSSSSCHYSTTTDPAGASLSINWVNPSDYSDPVEHAALQRASMGGAKLAGKLTASMPGVPGTPSGPVDGVGDEATSNMMMLTARKGDYTVTVQIITTDIMALMTDSTVGPGILEKEKNVARKVFTKV